VKALDHAIGEQRVGQRDQRHALVVRHIGGTITPAAGRDRRRSPALSASVPRRGKSIASKNP
jgi:hypothetical protein